MNEQEPHPTYPAPLDMGSATARQIDDLARAGFGEPSAIISMAVDRMWVQEVGARLPALVEVKTEVVQERLPARLEVWTLRADGETLYAVVLLDDSPFVATGPLQANELPDLTLPEAGVTVFPGWSSALAEELSVKRQEYDRRAAR